MPAKFPKKRNAQRREEYRQEKLERDLKLFERFQEEIAPKLRKMLAGDATAEDILEFGKKYAAARMVTEVINESDSNKALIASKDVLDRGIGKAKERTEHTHKFEKMPDNELDAVLASKLAEIQDAEKPEKH